SDERRVAEIPFRRRPTERLADYVLRADRRAKEHGRYAGNVPASLVPGTGAPESRGGAHALERGCLEELSRPANEQRDVRPLPAGKPSQRNLRSSPCWLFARAFIG